MIRNQDTNNKIVVIADDLTGANDTGVQFSKQGLQTVVLMGVKYMPDVFDEDVVVVDTQSRAMSPEAAYQHVTKTAMLFRDIPCKAIYKKVDSTLRGNLGQEIDAIMDTCGQELAIVAPAFPKNGRITVGGYHFLQGAPLEATEIARDPKCPITESHLPTLLASQTKRKVGHVGIKNIIAGSENILNAMRTIFNKGQRVIVCDIWQEEHLKLIALCAVQLEKHLLWVGSAGLAEYLPSVLGLGATSVGKDPVVVVAGSVSKVTRGQITKLKQRKDITSIEIDTCLLVQKESAHQEIRRCFNSASTAVTAGNDVVIASGYSGELVAKTIEKGLTLGLSSQQTAEIVAAALGGLCRDIATNIKLSGLVLTGGDIALSSCSLLSATGFKVVEEVAPGIPVGLLKGGLCDGLRVVTKAGAFGDENALCKSIDCLKQYKKELNIEPRCKQ